MLTHQPLHHLPPHSTADYFVNTVEQTPCLYVVERLHNNNVPLFAICTRINRPSSRRAHKPMYENVANTRHINTRQPQIDHLSTPNNIPPPISINNVYNVTNRIPFFDNNIFKNNNHGTSTLSHRFRTALGNDRVLNLCPRQNLVKHGYKNYKFLGLIYQ